MINAGLVKEFTDYVMNPDNIYKKEMYTGGRVMNSTAFGKEAHMRMQYCAGGYFAEGWIDGMKFRIYGQVTGGWRAAVCHADDVINEHDPDGHHTGGSTAEELIVWLTNKFQEITGEQLQ